jgi:hypothetical protein
MDSTAFHELIAQVRGTAAELAEAEQKVAAFKAELAQQEHGAQLDSALQKAIRPIPKHVKSGWLPSTATHMQREGDGLTLRRSNRAPAGSAAQDVGAEGMRAEVGRLEAGPLGGSPGSGGGSPAGFGVGSVTGCGGS